MLSVFCVNRTGERTSDVRRMNDDTDRVMRRRFIAAEVKGLNRTMQPLQQVELCCPTRAFFFMHSITIWKICCAWLRL